MIGGSTDSSTANRQVNLPVGSEPASFRYNNPGAQYPSADAAKFGQTGYGIIGGGHKIALFPSPVNGAASNFDLLYRKYTGKAIGEAGRIWTGDNGFGIPGYDPNIILTKDVIDDQDKAIAIMKAIAGRESGHGTNLTEDQWRQAYAMFKSGSADAYLRGAPPPSDIIITPPGTPGTRSGLGMLQRARAHIGQEYKNVQVPKDDPNWKGPWDCAEFVSWLVYQESNILYGCIDDTVEPSKADAYTGAWKSDVEKRGKRVSVEEASSTAGGIVLRYPPASGGMGHIAICDGTGGTVEAKGTRYGVIADTVQGRKWDTGILIPGISYGPITTPIEVKPPELVYSRTAPNMNPSIIVNIQQALLSKGYDLGPDGADGDFGENTEMAVVRFQEVEGLTVDGGVGKETADALGISLTDVSIHPPVTTIQEPSSPFPWDQTEPQILPTEFKLPPLGNWLMVAQYSMQLMSILRGFDVRSITIEEYMRRAIIFLQPEKPVQTIEGRVVESSLQVNKQLPAQTKRKAMDIPGLSGGNEQVNSTIRTILKIGGGILVGAGIMKAPQWADVLKMVEPWIGIASGLIGWWMSTRAAAPAGLLQSVANAGILAQPVKVTKEAELRDPRIAQLVSQPGMPVESETTRR